MAPSSPDVVTLPSSSSTVTIASSQLSFRSARSIASSPPQPDPETLQSEYRPARTLPYELQEHCAIYFEEGLYCQALNFLISLITAGSASPIPLAAFLPPPQFLSFISTLTVHPTLTTRAKSADRLQAANLAHRYLRLVLRHAGPIQSSLVEAFKYASVGGRGTGRRWAAELLPEKNYVGTIENDLANSGALFAQVETFWQVVGWAFNCSILHKKRWERWSSWLEYMIDVLEVDWEIGHRTDQMEQSMFVQYVISGGGQTDSGRRILRAVFADGRKTSVGEFKEIWQNETRELRKDGDVKKADKAINIEADDYGDYMSDEDDADLEEVSSKSISSSRSDSSTRYPAQATPNAEIPNAADRFGGSLALYLRFRLLSLLSKVALSHPPAFNWSGQQVTGGVERIYDLFLERIRPLSLPTFFLFMSPSTLRPLGPSAASVFAQYLLHRGSLIEGDAPEPASYVLTEESLLECHLPWAASNNSVADNAKVSICVETLMRLYDRHGGGLTWTQKLGDAAEDGVKRREDKAKATQAKRGRKRKEGTSIADDGEEWMFLRDSAARIRVLVEIAKECNGLTRQTQETELSAE